jgi:hypothetical protein
MDVDAHGERAYVYEPAAVAYALEEDALWECLESEDAGDGLSKVACIASGLEADEVCAEDAAEEGLADGHAAKYLGGGKCDVHEEANRHVCGQSGAQECGEEHEMVVIDPDCASEIRIGEREREDALMSPSW